VFCFFTAIYCILISGGLEEENLSKRQSSASQGGEPSLSAKCRPLTLFSVLLACGVETCREVMERI
jgi:hypothetical protein